MKFLSSLLALCSVPVLATLPAHAALRLDAPFGDHMVLQHDIPVVLWGSGAPGGDTVRVSIAGQTAVARSDWQGRWMVQLAPMKAGGPFQMNVQVGGVGPLVPSSAANNTDGLEVKDVLVGEVLPLSALQAENSEAGAGNAARGEAQHPFALVRVRAPAGASGSGWWRFVFADAVPKGYEMAFAVGSRRVRDSHMPVGVLEAAVLPACAPSTRCSAH